MSDELTADETAEVLGKMRHRFEYHGIGDHWALEQYVREVVENGQLFADSDLTVSRSLTLRERVAGSQEINVGRWLSMGMMLGAALERDVPAHTELDERFQAGEFTLPETGGDRDE